MGTGGSSAGSGANLVVVYGDSLNLTLGSANDTVRRAMFIFATFAFIAGCYGSRGAQAGAEQGPPTSQQIYAYPGCSNFDAYCPRMGTLACALRTIESKYNACSKHQDCVMAAFAAKCSGAGSCPPYFINQQSKTLFEAEAQKEIDRYCERATCSASGSGSCGLIEVEPYCASGHCTWIKVFAPTP